VAAESLLLLDELLAGFLARHPGVSFQLTQSPAPGYWQRALLDQLFAHAGRKAVIGCESDEPAAIPPLSPRASGRGSCPPHRGGTAPATL
jgi:hypothetical protein